MKRCICVFFLLFLLWGIDVSAIGRSVYTYFIITPEGEYKTLFIQAYNEVVINEKKYMSYSGFYEGEAALDNEVLLRQDGEKYFCYDVAHEIEHLMFDFGLQKGNTFTDGFSGIKYDVIDVRDTIANDVTRKLIELQSCDGEDKHDIWMEEVGSIYTGILPASDNLNELYLLTSSCLVQKDIDAQRITYNFYPNNQLVKTSNMKADCITWGKKIETEEDWEEYLNWCNAPSDLNAEFVGDTLCIRGRLRASCGIQSYAGCELKGNNVTFKIYRNGSEETDCFSIYDIDARIPRFPKGRYQVKLLNKTVELENTDGGYTSVSSVIASPVLNNNIPYNLLGCQLPQAPRRCIIIQNGKKVALK